MGGVAWVDGWAWFAGSRGVMGLVGEDRVLVRVTGVRILCIYTMFISNNRASFHL